MRDGAEKVESCCLGPTKTKTSPHVETCEDVRRAIRGRDREPMLAQGCKYKP